MQSQFVDSRRVARRWAGLGWVGIGQSLLIVAALLVGAAILAEPIVGRVLNGVGALAWVVAAALLGWGLRGTATRRSDGGAGGGARGRVGGGDPAG